MRYGMTIPLPGVALHEHRDWLARLEQLGYTDLWTQETGGLDAFTPLAYAAAVCPSLRLGTGIAQIPTRGPATLAMEAAALAEAAPGRFVLGIGSSSPAIVRDWNDLPFERPYSRARDTLRFLRRALAGERIDERYETFAVRGFRLERPPPAPPPIYVAALRERMLGLAASEADGALLGLVTAEDVARIAPLVRAKDASRDVVLRLAVCPIEDAERARAIGRRMLAAYLNVPSYARMHAWLGRGDLLAPLRDAWRARDREAAERALPDDLVDGLFIHGSADSCREQIARFVEAGVSTPLIGLFLPGVDLGDALRGLAPVRS
jgi:probable F420-dependent oxidoreductase